MNDINKNIRKIQRAIRAVGHKLRECQWNFIRVRGALLSATAGTAIRSLKTVRKIQRRDGSIWLQTMRMMRVTP